MFATIFCNHLAEFKPPKRRFGNSYKRRNTRLLGLFSAGVSTRFGRLTIEKSIKHPHFIFCNSFQNLRLGPQRYYKR